MSTPLDASLSRPARGNSVDRTADSVTGVRSVGRLGRSTLLLIILSVVVVPGQLANWWVERTFVVALAGVCAWVLWRYEPASLRLRRSVLVVGGTALVAQLLYLVSTIVAAGWLVDTTDDLGVVVETVRYLLFGLITAGMLLIGAWAGETDNEHPDEAPMYGVVLAVIGAISFGTLVLLASGLSVLEPLGSVYAETKTRIATSGIRVGAPFPNPNYLGFVSNLLLVIVLSDRRRTLLGRGVMGTVLLGIIVLTGSRTALFVAIMVLAVAAMPSRRLWRDVRLRTFALVSGMCALLALVLMLPYVAQLFPRLAFLTSLGGLADLASEPKVADRLGQFASTLGAVSRHAYSQVLGLGAPSGPVDNQYLQWLSRLGLLGTLLMGTALLYVLVRASGSRYRGPIVLLVLVTVTSLLAGAFLSNFRLLATWAFVVGYLSSMESTREPDRVV